MYPARQWLEAHGVEVLISDLAPGIAADYYVGWRQVIVSDDLDDLGLRRAYVWARDLTARRMDCSESTGTGSWK